LVADVVFAAEAVTQPVSYYRDIRPILMANCFACHKPDKMKAAVLLSPIRDCDVSEKTTNPSSNGNEARSGRGIMLLASASRSALMTCNIPYQRKFFVKHHARP